MRRRLIVAAWVGLAAISGVCFGQRAPIGARGFAIALARNDVPGGLVARQELLAQPPPSLGGETTAASKAAFNAGLESSLAQFNGAQESFRATQERGVVHIRSLEEPVEVGRALERSAQIREAVDVSAVGVVLHYVADAIREDVSPGIAGSGFIPECGLDRLVHLPAGSFRAIALLDEVVRQAPGIVWLVTYDRRSVPHHNLNIGVMCPNGATLTMNVFP